MPSLAVVQAQRTAAAQRQMRRRARVKDAFAILKQFCEPERLDTLDARMLGEFIADGTDPRGAEPLDRVRRLQRDHPEVVEIFGLGPVLVFARVGEGGRVPDSCCNWCPSFLIGFQFGDTQMPRFHDKTTSKRILGEPCPGFHDFLIDKRAKTAQTFDRIKRESEATLAKLATIREPVKSTTLGHTPQHDPTRCITCHQSLSIHAGKSVITASINPHKAEPPVKRSWCPTGCQVH